MSAPDYIEVTVRVPADLEVVRVEWSTDDAVKVMQGAENVKWVYRTKVGDGDWRDDIAQQIAAAVEARKPKPPKFQVGDVVEWVTVGGERRAGVVGDFAFRDGGIIYFLNGVLHYVSEADLKLVRRAEK